MTAPTRLIVLRGNSGSGKTTTARALRTAYGRRGLAVVGQDVIRRDILRERDEPGGVNIGLIDTITRYSLEHGHHVVLEGIFTAGRYGPMLAALGRDYANLNDLRTIGPRLLGDALVLGLDVALDRRGRDRAHAGHEVGP